MAEITFSEIANDIKTPGVYMEIDDKLLSLGLSGKEGVGLVLGQKLAEGTAAYDKVYTVYSPEDATELGGIGSEIDRMAQIWFKNNENNALKIVAVEQTSGQAATYNITFGGENIKAGQTYLLIGGYQVQIDVAEGDTPEEIAAALIEGINETGRMPFTASSVAEQTSQLLLTAKHKGTAYNKIPMILNYYDGQKTASGLTITIAEGAEGSGNVSLAEALAVLGDEYFTDGITNYNDDANIRLLRDVLAERFKAMQHNAASIHLPFMGTFSEYITKAASINSMHIVLHPCLESVSMPDEFVAASVAAITYRTQLNPGLQYRGMKLNGILPAKKALTQKERNLFLNNGVSTVTVDTSGNVYLERTVTTYVKNAQNQKTESWLDLWKVKLVTYLRYSFINHMAAAFPCFKLAGDDFEVQEGQEVATPLTIKAETMVWAKMCQKAALIEKLNEIIAAINSSDQNRADELIRPNLINNLMVIAAKMQPTN